MTATPKKQYLPLPESREPTYTHYLPYSPSPSDVAAWQEQPTRIKAWREEVPVRSKAMQVKPELGQGSGIGSGSGSSLSLGKGVGVGSAEWSERDKSAGGSGGTRGGGVKGVVRRQVGSAAAGQEGRVVDDRAEKALRGEGPGAAGSAKRHPESDVKGQPPVQRQLGSRASTKPAPRRSEPLDLQPRPSAGQTLLAPPTSTPLPRHSPVSDHAQQPRAPHHPPRSAPSARSVRSARDAYIADALAIPDEVSRPVSLVHDNAARTSNLELPLHSHTQPGRKSRSAASREQVGDGLQRMDGRKAKSSGSTTRLREEGWGGYRSAATTPSNPHAIIMQPAQAQEASHGEQHVIRQQASRYDPEAVSAERLAVPSSAPLERQLTHTKRSITSADGGRGSRASPAVRTDPQDIVQQGERGRRGRDAHQIALAEAFRSPPEPKQREGSHLPSVRSDRPPRESRASAALQAHFEPATYPLPASVVSATSQANKFGSGARMPVKEPQVPGLAGSTSTRRQPHAAPSPQTPDTLTPPTAHQERMEYVNIATPTGDHLDARITRKQADKHEAGPAESAGPDSELSTNAGQPDHISFEVPSGSRGRLRVSLAWFRDREGGRRRRHTDITPGTSARDGMVGGGHEPPPLPPKDGRPPRSPVRRIPEEPVHVRNVDDMRTGMHRSPSFQRQSSPVSPRRYDTSPSQYPNAMLHRSNTYMTNLPPYQPTAPVTAYRVQFPQNLPVPMPYQQAPMRPYGNPNWAMHSMPHLQAPPPTLASPTRTAHYGPPQTVRPHEPFPATLGLRTDYAPPPSPRRPPSIEPPCDASPPAPLRRLPSTRMDPMNTLGAPTGYGGIGPGNTERMPLVTPMVLRPPDRRFGDAGVGGRKDVGQDRPNMWQRMFNLDTRRQYTEDPAQGRIKRWRSVEAGRPPVQTQVMPATRVGRDEQHLAQNESGQRGNGAGVGVGMSMLTRFLGSGQIRGRPPIGDLKAPPVATPALHPQDGPHLPEPYTPAPKTKFGNLGLTGRQRRFKTYQPTQIDKLEMQQRQRRDERIRERDQRKEERRNAKRRQREEKEERRAQARAARIAAAATGPLGGLGVRQHRPGEMRGERGRLQRRPSASDGMDARERTGGGNKGRTGGGIGAIGEWLAKVQRSRGR